MDLRQICLSQDNDEGSYNIIHILSLRFKTSKRIWYYKSLRMRGSRETQTESSCQILSERDGGIESAHARKQCLWGQKINEHEILADLCVYLCVTEAYNTNRSAWRLDLLCRRYVANFWTHTMPLALKSANGKAVDLFVCRYMHNKNNRFFSCSIWSLKAPQTRFLIKKQAQQAQGTFSDRKYCFKTPKTRVQVKPKKHGVYTKLAVIRACNYIPENITSHLLRLHRSPSDLNISFCARKIPKNEMLRFQHAY